jgi:hypothetical protein
MTTNKRNTTFSLRELHSLVLLYIFSWGAWFSTRGIYFQRART